MKPSFMLFCYYLKLCTRMRRRPLKQYKPKKYKPKKLQIRTHCSSEKRCSKIFKISRKSLRKVKIDQATASAKGTKKKGHLVK